ncbi:MAG: SDR family oxidoreductase [Arenicellales bacterium]|nr:SDR family oxidoreductase [Arenicellales bacterium]
MPNVLITGASRGLGLEFARQYASAGWRVHAGVRNLHGRPPIDDLKHDNVTTHDLDVSNHGQIQAVARRLVNQPIDLLINNAGLWLGENEHYGRCDDAQWFEEFRVHVFGTMAMCEAFIAHIKMGDLKLIANISSANGSLTLDNGVGDYPYNTSKAALNLITRGLATDLEKYAISVICLSPGFVATDMSGPNADLTPEESVSAMRDLFKTLGRDASGTFLRYNGQFLPW